MSIMPRLAAFVATLSPRLAMVTPAFGVTAKTTASFGSAQYTYLTPKSDGPGPLHPLALALRSDLAQQIKAAQPRSQRKAELTARAKALTCEILRKGASYEGR